MLMLSHLAVVLTYGRNFAQWQQILEYLAGLSVIVWALVLVTTLYRSLVMRLTKRRRGEG